MSDLRNELSRPEKLAKVADSTLLQYAADWAPGSDAHYDAIMEICNRGLHETQVGKTACSYLPELKIRLGQRTELAQFKAQVAQQLAGLLLHSLHKLPADNPYRELGEACNRSVRAAATALGITLP